MRFRYDDEHDELRRAIRRLLESGAGPAAVLALAEADAEFLVILAGTDETWAQTVHARSSYKFDEVEWGARFASIFLRPEDGGRMGVALDRLSEIERPGR